MPTFTMFDGNAVEIDRRFSTSASTTGEPIWTVSTVYVGLPCTIDRVPVPSDQAGAIRLETQGVVFIATHVGLFTGLSTAQIPAGTSAGASFSYAGNGVRYIVDANGLAAYPDVEYYDRVTDERGAVYIAANVAKYFGPIPELQVTLQEGRQW